MAQTTQNASFGPVFVCSAFQWINSTLKKGPNDGKPSFGPFIRLADRFARLFVVWLKGGGDGRNEEERALGDELKMNSHVTS